MVIILRDFNILFSIEPVMIEQYIVLIGVAVWACHVCMESGIHENVYAMKNPLEQTGATGLIYWFDLYIEALFTKM